jgi:hypothetical protein
VEEVEVVERPQALVVQVVPVEQEVEDKCGFTLGNKIFIIKLWQHT